MSECSPRPVMLGLCAVAAVASACGSSTDRCGPTSAVVERVIDGDTIELTDGRRVRYLLVDAPETTSGKNDCYGQEAVAFNKAAVEGKTVELTYDVECTDRYGRLLAYVKVNGQEVNTQLVSQGYACVLHISPNGDSRAQQFADLELIAKAQRTGMWGVCTTIKCE